MIRTAISPRFAIRIFFRLLILLEGRGRRRRAAMMRCLLVRVCQLEECRFAPGTAEQLKAGRQRPATGKAHRYRDRGKTGAGCEELAVVAAWRVQIANEPRRIAPRRVGEGVELTRVHQLQHSGAELFAELVAALAARRLSRHIVS